MRRKETITTIAKGQVASLAFFSLELHISKCQQGEYAFSFRGLKSQVFIISVKMGAERRQIFSVRSWKEVWWNWNRPCKQHLFFPLYTWNKGAKIVREWHACVWECWACAGQQEKLPCTFISQGLHDDALAREFFWLCNSLQKTKIKLFVV